MVFLALGVDLFACILAPAMFMLFSKAYPCIIDVDADICLTPHLMLVLGVLLPSLLPTPSSLFLNLRLLLYRLRHVDHESAHKGIFGVITAHIHIIGTSRRMLGGNLGVSWRGRYVKFQGTRVAISCKLLCPHYQEE